MSLGFGVSYIAGKLDFYLDTKANPDRNEEIIVEAYADLDDNANINAALGFLNFQLSNLLKDGHQELSAAFTVDLKDPGIAAADGRLSLTTELKGIKFSDIIEARRVFSESIRPHPQLVFFLVSTA